MNNKKERKNTIMNNKGHWIRSFTKMALRVNTNYLLPSSIKPICFSKPTSFHYFYISNSSSFSKMVLRVYTNYLHPPSIRPICFNKPTKFHTFCVRNSSSFSVDADTSDKLVLQVKEKLEKDYNKLPVGKNGRDDEEMIFWFLKDRKFSVHDAVRKLSKAIKWRQDFRVSDLSEDTVRKAALTGKAFVHDYSDVNDRPVLVVVASKHFPSLHDPLEDEKLCVFLVEKALRKLPEGKEDILVIIDLRHFGTENADMKFITFLFDVFYSYYPRRLSQVLFVEAPFVFKPIWQLTKPLLKSYASLVRFCSVKTVQEDYFTKETLPASFRD